MLVEMSGIPYGLMSEMLDHPNAWHGMVFGMRTRWPWSGDPRAQWRLEQQFGIEDSEFIGWWDESCPVKIDHPDCKVSVYRKNGKTLIALSSWARTNAKVKLQIDWKALGLSPQKATLWEPACEKFQNEAVFAADSEIRVEANKGWMFIVDETPREILLPLAMKNPSEGLRELASAPALDLNIPANTVSTKDLAWVKGATVAMAQLDPKKDAGQSWGLGLALGWNNGKSLQINARTDGRWSIRRNGQEMLEGEHPAGQPATVAFRLSADQVQLLASRKDGEWELVKAFPRSDFPGEPVTVRYGKIGTTWNGHPHSDLGNATPCRVEWVKLY
jgi:hypothetical protein